jgi:hypothetical protein
MLQIPRRMDDPTAETNSFLEHCGSVDLSHIPEWEEGCCDDMSRRAAQDTAIVHHCVMNYLLTQEIYDLSNGLCDKDAAKLLGQFHANHRMCCDIAKLNQHVKLLVGSL